MGFSNVIYCLQQQVELFKTCNRLRDELKQEGITEFESAIEVLKNHEE